MPVGLAAALAAALAFGLGALLQAVAARAAPTGTGVDLRLLAHLLRRPPFLAAVALTLAGGALHLVALRSLPLFLAQTVVSSSVAVTALAGTLVLRTRLGRGDLLAVLAVCVGLAVLTATAQEAGEVATSAAGRTLLLAAAAALLPVGALAARSTGVGGAAALGLVGGLGFAVVAVSVRVLPSLAPGRLLREPAAYAVALAGPLAFLLYSLALQRAGVLVGTAATVVGQTVAPALVGLLLLGDRVRSGSAPLLVAGLLLAVGGAAVLARLEAGQPAPS